MSLNIQNLIKEFFEREVLPFAPDAWWDIKDTKIGNEINFAKYFDKHQPPRALADNIEQETENLLKGIVE